MTEKKFFHYCTSSIIWFFCIVSHINADEYKASNRMIEEVMVVAQKREEKMQDIPISVQAFSENRLEAMGITSIADLQLVAPGMNYTETSGFGIIYIRGVGSDTFLMGLMAFICHLQLDKIRNFLA